MSALSCILIGGDRLTLSCAEMLVARGDRVTAVVTRDPALTDWAKAAGVPCLTPDADLPAALADHPADWILSVANFDILSAETRALARKGAVNFHDGPLPQRAGLNAPVWALIEGDTRHGIAWHLMEDGIDTGPVLIARELPIEPADTALTLNTKCLAAALDSFPDLLDLLARGATEGVAQDLSARRHHTRDDRPAMQAWLDLARPAGEIERLVRALDHGGYDNPLCLPKLRLGGAFVVTRRVVLVEGAGAPGTVLKVTSDSVTLACGTGALRFEALCDLEGASVDLMALVKPGDVAPRPDGPDPATLARHEPFWRDALSCASEAALTGLGTPSGETRSVDLPLAEAAAALAAYLQQGTKGTTLWVIDRASADWVRTGLVAALRPVIVPAAETRADLADALSTALDAAARHETYARDLPLRIAALEGWPKRVDVALSLGAGPATDVAVTVELTEAGAVIHADTGAVSDAVLAEFVTRLTAIAETAPDAPLHSRKVAPLEGPEIAVPDATMSALFEAQVDRTPEATALIFGTEELSYAELDRRANRVAHLLRQAGIGPDRIVGLCVPRGIELMTGALGILKAGGAYLPVDPAYPAERRAHVLADSGAPVILTLSGLVDDLPRHEAEVICLDTDPRLTAAPETRPAPVAGPDDLAYVIYTSGSTGRPKGVMVEHRNVANFYAGMDRVVPEPGGVWLAVTSLSFDISVLELFYTTARGYTVVMASDAARALPGTGEAPRPQSMDLSLYLWGSDAAPGPDAYRLMLEGARFADRAGFRAVWTPERHFHEFGGQYPNPAVTGAAIAAVTERIDVRAGSCVAPLHHPARIAEEWAVIDTLTGGRAGLALASGWQPDDFVLRPENAPPAHKAALSGTVETLRALWAGEAVAFPRGDGTSQSVVTHPRPVSQNLPLWLTTAGNPDTWEEAGRLGVNVLTHLLGQSIAELGEKIALYRRALSEAGHDPDRFTVTVMLHTYLAESRDAARAVAEAPMKRYLRSAAGLLRGYAWSFPAFKRPAESADAADLDLDTLSEAEMEAVLDHAFQRYFTEQGLFGTVEDAAARLAALADVGVGEVACLVDFGIPAETALDGLAPLARLLETTPTADPATDETETLAGLMRRHGVTHLQCTPSMARLLTEYPDARAALGRVRHLFFGGEALPGPLVETFLGFTNARIRNMYGPTETTIWSTSTEAGTPPGTVDLGAPIANTRLHILRADGTRCRTGETGELWIGGAGVTRGYLGRPELTAERFRTDVVTGDRLYRTGDLVRREADGKLAFLGRADQQIKIRGHRVEPGEIEARLSTLPGVDAAAVVARTDTAGAPALVAYVTGRPGPDAELRATLGRVLPAHMLPARIVRLQALPLTPNGKIDRARLPDPDGTRELVTAAETPPAPDAVPGDTPAAQIAAIWSRLLGVPHVGAQDNFFDLGGHSLLAVQAHRAIVGALEVPDLSITDIFRCPTLEGLAARVADLRGADAAPAPDLSADRGAARARQRSDAMARRRAMRAERMGERA